MFTGLGQCILGAENEWDLGKSQGAKVQGAEKRMQKHKGVSMHGHCGSGTVTVTERCHLMVSYQREDSNWISEVEIIIHNPHELKNEFKADHPSVPKADHPSVPSLPLPFHCYLPRTHDLIIPLFAQRFTDF